MVDTASPRPDTRDYHSLLLTDTPLIDVRAPVEFAQGAMPGARNLPLMFDDERAAVGRSYKQQGQKAAIELGHSLVQGDFRAERIATWQTFCAAHPEGYLCCARGGLRSHIVQQWLAETGVDYPLVDGGYRALRQYAVDAIERLSLLPMVLVAGNTGCGKTLMVNDQGTGVDLEGLAHHRGSSFGRTLTAQPSQASFENRLGGILLKIHHHHSNQRHFRWVIEDEGQIIGSRHIPMGFHRRMGQSPLVVIEDPFDLRLERLQEQYFIDMARGFIHQDGELRGWENYGAYLRQGLDGIRKRLGLERYKRSIGALENALRLQQRTGDSTGHLQWLVPLLQEYYDPMYQYQLSKRADKIVMRGDYQQVNAWLKSGNGRG